MDLDTTSKSTGIADLIHDEAWQEVAAAVAELHPADVADIIDQAPPTDPAQAGFVLQSGVQVCAQDVDERSVERYLESVYGVGTPGFEQVELAERIAYRNSDGSGSIIFVQTETHRLQIVTFVAADQNLEAERRAQVEAILEGLVST